MKGQTQGYTELVFKRRGDRNIAHTVYHTGNSRVSSAIQRGPQAIPYYFLITTGGGFIEGERYEADIRAEEGSHAIVTTQTPTYVFKCERGLQTTQENRLVVEAGAVLEYLADEIIPYKNAYYLQETRVDLGADSVLVFTDGLTAGWSPEDLPFTYGEVGNHTEIYRQGNLVYNDFLLINPKVEPMGQIGYFEGYRNMNSLVIIDDKVTEALIDDMRCAVDAFESPVIYGISYIDGGGLVMRVLGDSAYENRKSIQIALAVYREGFKQWPHLDLRKNDK